MTNAELHELVEFGSRFYAKVKKGGADECWQWTGSKDKKGYGRACFNGKSRLATHVALLLDGRPRPSAQMFACHSCDNPSCVNPAHLWWGTVGDNMRDAAAKGRLHLQRNPGACFFASPEGLLRRAKGSNHGSAKLTEGDVLLIRERLAGGEEHRAVGLMFGVKESTISLIARGKTWSHV